METHDKSTRALLKVQQSNARSDASVQVAEAWHELVKTHEAILETRTAVVRGLGAITRRLEREYHTPGAEGLPLRRQPCHDEDTLGIRTKSPTRSSWTSMTLRTTGMTTGMTTTIP